MPASLTVVLKSSRAMNGSFGSKSRPWVQNTASKPTLLATGWKSHFDLAEIAYLFIFP